jgi:hypothetical protein
MKRLKDMKDVKAPSTARGHGVSVGTLHAFFKRFMVQAFSGSLGTAAKPRLE